MDLQQKLTLLADAAKYDASCASSGTVKRDSLGGGIGSTAPGMGICHAYAPDGRCISLLKILLTNFCIYDCAYCINRSSSNTRRARFSVDEVVQLTMTFYKRNFGDVARHICMQFTGFIGLKVEGQMSGGRLVFDHTNHIDGDTLPFSLNRYSKILSLHLALQMHRICCPCRVAKFRQPHFPLSILCNDLSLRNHHIRFEIMQIIHQHHIGPAPGSDHAHFL